MHGDLWIRKVRTNFLFSRGHSSWEKKITAAYTLPGKKQSSNTKITDTSPLNVLVVYHIKSTGSLYQSRTVMPNNEALCLFT